LTPFVLTNLDQLLLTLLNLDEEVICTEPSIAVRIPCRYLLRPSQFIFVAFPDYVTMNIYLFLITEGVILSKDAEENENEKYFTKQS
jgi:hypothetical protein